MRTLMTISDNQAGMSWHQGCAGVPHLRQKSRRIRLPVSGVSCRALAMRPVRRYSCTHWRGLMRLKKQNRKSGYPDGIEIISFERFARCDMARGISQFRRKLCSFSGND